MKIILCPKCKANLQVSDDYKGEVICPRCKTKIFYNYE